MVAHAGGRQGEHRVAWFERRYWRHMSGAEAWLGWRRICLAVMVRAALGAGAAGVGAGTGVARVCQLGAVQTRLAGLTVLL